jgi:hypothetical protein
MSSHVFEIAWEVVNKGMLAAANNPPCKERKERKKLCGEKHTGLPLCDGVPPRDVAPLHVEHASVSSFCISFAQEIEALGSFMRSTR